MSKKKIWDMSLILPVAALFVVTCTVFFKTIHFDFTGYDENIQIVENPLVKSLAFKNMYKIFSSFSIVSYYPVRLLTFAFDYFFWGINPTGYHLSNLLIHAANAIFIYLLMVCFSSFYSPSLKLTAIDKTCFFLCALLFAVHPVVVEPVAWIGGREELLALFFTQCCLLIYLLQKMAKEPKKKYSIGVIIFCVLACLSNVIGALIPFLLSAFNYSFNNKKQTSGKNQIKKIVEGTVLLWCIAIGTIVLKILGKNILDEQGFVTATLSLGIKQRVQMIFTLYGATVKKLLWPTSLSIIYPDIDVTQTLSMGLFFGIFTVVITIILFQKIKNSVILFGFLWFVIGLLPSAQIISHHIVGADRFLYFPLAGLTLCIGFFIKEINPAGRLRKILFSVTTACLLLMTVLSINQSLYWENGISLFSRAVSINPKSALAHNNLGHELFVRGDVKKAQSYYKKALLIDPSFVKSHNNLGFLFAGKGEVKKAISYYKTALKIKPDYRRALHNYGLILSDMKRYSDAHDIFFLALKKNPDDADAFNNLGLLAGKQGDLKEAILYFEKAIFFQPSHGQAHFNLGITYLSLEEFEKSYNALFYAKKLFSGMYGAADEKSRRAQKLMKKVKQKLTNKERLSFEKPF